MAEIGRFDNIDGKPIDDCVPIEIENLEKFIALDKDVYKGGMNAIQLPHVLRETAKYNLCDFADVKNYELVLKAVKEQHDSGHDTLIGTDIEIDKEKPESIGNLIQSLAATRTSDPYKKILFPVCTCGYGVPHATALAIEGNDAYLFEQLGGNAYKELKDDLTKALTKAGLTVHINRKPLTDGNRLDCATVSNAIISRAIKAESIKQLFDAVESNPSPFFTHEQIDAQHVLDQNRAKIALKDLKNGHRDDRNNSADVILFQKLLSKTALKTGTLPPQDIEAFWNAKDKNDFVNNYEHIMTQNQQLEDIFNAMHIPKEVQEKILASLNDSAAKDALIRECENYNNDYHEISVNYQDHHDSIDRYYNLKENDYGTGTYTVVSSLVTWKIAQKHDVCFVDSIFTGTSGKNKDTELKTRIEASKNKAKNPQTIVLGPIETSRTENGKTVFDPNTLSIILNSAEIKNSETAIMPLALTDATNGKRHMVSLILRPNAKSGKPEASLIDQCGRDAYKESKDQIKDLLQKSGFNLTYEPDRIMDNRNDCAIFAAMINDAAIGKSADELKTYIENVQKKSQDEKAAEVDKYNGQCKQITLNAYWEVCTADPLFKQYLKASGVDISTLDNAQKMQYLKEFNSGGVLTVEDNQNDDDRVSDPIWKQEIREAVEKANQELSQKFEEYTDSEHPDRLFFRDQNNAGNIIAFASKEQAYVEGEQAAFDQLVVTAKKMGKDTIAFGSFEKHPEYRAKLYLACLKHGLKMTNAPELDSLQQYPEYAAIQNIISGEEKKKSEEEKPKKIKELREKFRAIDQELNTARREFMENDECKKLLKEYSKTKGDRNMDKDEKKTKLAEIQDQIKETAVGKKLAELADKKAQLFQKGFADGIIDEKRANDAANRRRDPIDLKQKTGETDEDFAARKEKLEKAQKRPRLVEEVLAANVQRRILRQAITSKKTR